ncbi:hypothetical protein GY45DRAFT_1340677 [Cubamyces sp. BRFM 1775]|nr:hypothetical protein GY45DRAFT_1340677 [Cubamyces sp. BRFM 1775]
MKQMNGPGGSNSAIAQDVVTNGMNMSQIMASLGSRGDLTCTTSAHCERGAKPVAGMAAADPNTAHWGSPRPMASGRLVPSGIPQQPNMQTTTPRRPPFSQHNQLVQRMVATPL